MSDLIKSEASKVTSTRGTRGRKAAADRAKVEMKAADHDIDLVAGSTLVSAAVDLADAELGAATRAYGDRTAQNLARFSDFTRMVQAKTAAAIRSHAFDTFEVTEDELYGTPTDS